MRCNNKYILESNNECRRLGKNFLSHVDNKINSNSHKNIASNLY